MTGEATVRTWWAEPPPGAVRHAIERLARSEGAARIAVMPDVHLAEDVCIGVVLATESRLVPAAVGGDIGCGMATLALGVRARALRRAAVAARVLEGFAQAVPIVRHKRRDGPALPPPLAERALRSPTVAAVATREAALQFATLGRGNHFVELQADEDDELWVTVHSGSRGLGPAMRTAYERAATPDRTGLRGLPADSSEGRDYLADVQWALDFAAASRRGILAAACEVATEVLGAEPRAETLVACHHNFVRLEMHDGRPLWVHRKGANSAQAGEAALIPGSMGAPSYHVEGRGCPEAMCSSSHGAGRAMSRSDARRRITPRRLHEQLRGVWFDHRLSRKLCEEAPGAYKDIGAVMRAQHDLVRIVRRLRPVLVYKGA